MDPSETWAPQEFRSAKTLVRSFAECDIVAFIAWARPPEGAHGNSNPLQDLGGKHLECGFWLLGVMPLQH
jgi:hypothetical protein